VTERLRLPPAAAGRPETLWCHCASLGEAKGLWGLVRDFLQRESATGRRIPFRIHLTANTAIGLDFLRRQSQEFRARLSGLGNVDGGPDAMGPGGTRGCADADAIEISTGMAPFDHPGWVRRYLIAGDVKALCLFETELWPNYIRVGADLGIPVSLVSARLSDKALSLYRRFPRATGSVMGKLAWIQAQSDCDRDRFQSLSRAPATTGFDFKAAHYLRDLRDPRRDSPLAFGTSRIAFVSLHLHELRKLLPELPALLERYPVAVFPRHMRELAGFHRLLGPLGFVLHSRDAQARNLIVDSMGKVESILPGCHSAFVGGSLIPAGCHNLWEPLRYGLKTYFGSEYGNQESLARMLLDRGIAEVVLDVRKLREWREPGPEVAAACTLLLDGQQEMLEAALAECRGRIFATFEAEPRHAAVATLSTLSTK